MTYLVPTEADLRRRKRDLSRADVGLQAERNRIRNEVEKIDALLPTAPVDEVEVMDHAVVRWLERKEGVDIAAIRQRIAAVVIADGGYGRERVVQAAGVKLVVAENRVVTVLEEGHRLKKSTLRVIRRRPAVDPTPAVPDGPFAVLATLNKATPPNAPKPCFIERLGEILSCVRSVAGVESVKVGWK